MGVVMRGGTSGNREDALASSPSFDRQPIEDTSNNSGMGPGVVFPSQCTGNREYAVDPGMPKGGSNPIMSQGEPGLPASDAAPADIFKGSKSNPGL